MSYNGTACATVSTGGCDGSARVRVFLIDHHEMIRRGICDLVNGELDLEIVGESDCAARAVPRIAATLPNVVVLGLHLPDGNGIELCGDIRAAHPDIRCIVFTGHASDDTRAAAVVAGAWGYITKDTSGTVLLDGIRRVSRGALLFSETGSAGSPDSQSEPWSPSLTMREQQALDLITRGLTNRQIGERLGLAEKTVKNYVSGLLAKLGMERRTQVAAYGASMPATPQPAFTRSLNSQPTVHATMSGENICLPIHSR